MTDPDPSIKELAANLSAETEQTAGAVVVEGQADGDQTFGTGRNTASSQRTAAEFNRDERRKDNELRRQLVKAFAAVAISILFVAFGYGIIVGTNAENADTRRAAQSVLALIVGGILGAAAGYVAGRGGK